MRYLIMNLVMEEGCKRRARHSLSTNSLKYVLRMLDLHIRNTWGIKEVHENMTHSLL